METIEMRLEAVRFAARDTHVFEFARPDGGLLPDAAAGAHIDLHLPGGMIRPYSLVEAVAAPRCYRVGVKRDPTGRGGSRFMHDGLRVGSVLPVGVPRNNFPLHEGAAPAVLIAGGIGITPIWCMAQRLQAQGRAWSIHYSCRSRVDAAFLAPLQAWREGQFHFDDEQGGRLLDLAAVVAGAPAGAHLYCCGPAPMLAAFEAASASLPRAQVHVEYFTAVTPPADGGGFTVELARSKRSLPVPVPAGRTILEVLTAAGISVSSSCEQGICGACETRVIAGVPDHRDQVLSDAERAAGELMMICCSGCLGEKLVLDL